ncbi:TIGR01841 family phasin [Duganella sp. FT80W]|uniref:TIGR01841 family phasin n=1 Tax=Duganella guangzhouensis TaxID=2666084 RepID=A0A6I2L2C4_9BURK|nr:phasin family protein [Duganella guangzhouensis]MRW92308.1 TIGR01841 family phasin [Duganella guangzhouensis]
MSSITEQFSAATKSQLEAQFQIFSTLANTAVDSAEKVIALNISTTKASVEKSSSAAKKLWSAKDPKEFFTLSTTEPASFDGLLAYGRELYSIATTAQNELIQSAQSTLKQVTDLAATKATVLSKATPPALAAAVSAAVTAANEPTAVVAGVAAEPAPVPKAPKAAKPAAAPIEIPEEDTFVEVKVEAKPPFPSAAIALDPEAKPAKAAAKKPAAKK